MAKVMTVEEVRERLRIRRDPCHPDCRGWDVFATGRGLEVERCDDCFHGEEDPLGDDDVELLPEAQEALRIARLGEGVELLLVVEAGDAGPAVAAALEAAVPGAASPASAGARWGATTRSGTGAGRWTSRGRGSCGRWRGAPGAAST